MIFCIPHPRDVIRNMRQLSGKTPNSALSFFSTWELGKCGFCVLLSLWCYFDVKYNIFFSYFYTDWDLGVCLHYECKRKQLMKPSALTSWIDLRATYKVNFMWLNIFKRYQLLEDWSLSYRDAKSKYHKIWSQSQFWDLTYLESSILMLLEWFGAKTVFSCKNGPVDCRNASTLYIFPNYKSIFL